MDVVMAWAATLVIGFTASAVLAAASKSCPFHRAALLIGVLCAIFFSFGGLAQLLSTVGVHYGTIWLLCWTIVLIGGGGLTWIASRHTAFRQVVLVAAATMVAVPTVELASGTLHSGSVEPATANSQQLGAADHAQPHDGRRHNVYWFLLDGYVRGDSLAKYFDHDNEPFLRSLEQRGFDIARSAYSNYDNTTNSLSTTLTMDYYYLPGQEKPDTRIYTRVLSGFNGVVRRFKGLGYRYMHAPYAGSAKTQCSGVEDRCIRAGRTDRTPLSDVQISLLRLTPIYRIIRKVSPDAFSYDHLFVEDVEPEISRQAASPFFLFAHILAPHAPPRFTPECKRLGDIAPSIDVGEGVYDPQQFRTDTRCLNLSVSAIIDRILESDASDPIIVIQGDHGFSFRLAADKTTDWNVASDRSLQERRLAILNAIRLPPRCRGAVYSKLSPVNTFRVVFACLEGRAARLLPDRHFFRAKDGDGYRLIEMSGAN